MRDLIFAVGCVLMALALLFGLFRSARGDSLPAYPFDAWLYGLGLFLAVASHGWPASFS